MCGYEQHWCCARTFARNTVAKGKSNDAV
jgi:hypothetical protein